MNTAKTEAIATADANLNNVGLPTYSDTLEALHKLVDMFDKHTMCNELNTARAIIEAYASQMKTY